MKGTPRAPWTPEQDKKLRSLVLSAKSVDTIAGVLNRTTFAVRRRANTLRLPLKDCEASQTDLIPRFGAKGEGEITRGGNGQMLHLLLDWEYPHWMMMAGAILVALGFIGLAFHRNRNVEPVDKPPEMNANGK